VCVLGKTRDQPNGQASGEIDDESSQRKSGRPGGVDDEAAQVVTGNGAKKATSPHEQEVAHDGSLRSGVMVEAYRWRNLYCWAPQGDCRIRCPISNTAHEKSGWRGRLL